MDQAIAGNVIKPADLPAPPKDAIRFVQACSNPAVDARELASIVANDPVLTAELLRIANSAWFGLVNPVKSVSRAVTVMGSRALRNLVLCICMQDALRAEEIPGFNIELYWEDALRRAASARQLSDLAGLDADECFTAGLLQDFGLLVLLHLHPNQVQHWTRLSLATPEERRDIELDLFHTTHDEVGLSVALSWGLPADLAVAMGYHHDGAPADVEPQDVQLCKVSTCADWMAAVYKCEDKREAIRNARALLAEYFATSPQQTDRLLEQVADSVTDAASTLGMHVNKQATFEEVLREANLRLAEENLSYQELNWRLEQTLAERDRIAQELQQELELAREVQKSLLPGGPLSFPGVTGVNLSAKAVSGDFYDYFQLVDGRIAFCLADVSGKGVNAALLMAKTASLFRCLGKGVLDPGKLLGMLNREIAETSIRGMFVTMLAGIFDPATDEVVLANAGHLPALHMGCAALIGSFPASAPPLGVVPEMVFPNERFSLQGGSLYLYSDGLLEARIGDQFLQQKGLIKLFREQAHLPVEERAQAVVAAVFCPEGTVDDDLTLLIIQGQDRYAGQ